MRVEKVPTQSTLQGSKKVSKFLKFPLDNYHKVWYNTSVPRERNKNWVVTYHENGEDVYGKQEDDYG